MKENTVPSLGWEDVLEKGKAIHSSRGAWQAAIHGGHKESNTTEGLSAEGQFGLLCCLGVCLVFIL